MADFPTSSRSDRWAGRRWRVVSGGGTTGAMIAATTAVLALVLAGCGSADGGTGGDPTTGTGSASASPTGSDTPSASDSAVAAADQRLLPASALAGGPWKEQLTDNANDDPFGPCARFSMLSIGGGTVVQRTYTAAAGRTAAEQIVEFPDAKTGWRAAKVLDTWQQDCVDAAPTTPHDVTVAAGTAMWYQATVKGKSVGFGTVRDGATMALVMMDLDDDSTTPLEQSIVAAAKRLDDAG